ncbi:MAG TPA: TolC family protein [Polyangiaceae bacterium]|nr:TolC family protein [Polyangiaceae bacterium]
MPDVSDPLLETPPPPANVLQSWQQALQLVRDQSVSMRLARVNVQRAEAQVKSALSPALPQLVGTAGVTQYLLKGEVQTATGTRSIPDPSTYWNAQLALTVPIFRPFAWSTYGSAKDAVEASKLSAKEVERQVVGGFASVIVTVVTAERLAEVSRSSLRAALSTLDLTKRRAALGASNTLDVLRVEGEASLARAQVVSATEALMRAREALGTALGSSESWGVMPDIKLDSLATDAQKVCRPEQDISSRTDVRAAKANLGVNERRLKAIDYSYLPTLDGVSALGVQDPNFALNNRAVNWTIGALLTWTIYDGGLRGGQRLSAAAEVEGAKAELAETRRSASLELTQALRNVQVAEADYAVSAKTREINAETVRLSKISFLNGSGTSFDLVLTERQLRISEADLAVSEFSVLQAKIAALLALSTCNLP